MDHPHAHAHPASSSHDTRPRQQAARARTFGISHTPSPVQHDRIESLASPHQRRLQLRNAGFRGTQLSTHNISKKFSRLFHGNEEPQSAPAPGRTTNQSHENTTPVRRNIKSSRSYQSSLGILNEITNSTRNRYRKPVPIFEDNPERPLLEDSPAASSPTYHDTPSSPLVASNRTIEAVNMHLTELSGNEWRSPPPICDSSSESQKYPSIRVGSRRRVSSRKVSHVSPGYTEHIENLLQTSRAQAHSPQSGVPFRAKFEAAKVENNKLKEIIQELEDAFDQRVKEAVEHMTSTEVELRRRVKILEDEVDQKSLTISELEYQQAEARVDLVVLDALKATIEKLESEKQSLEDSNRSISRRNEVLTELLAISPSKSQHGLGFSSPARNGPRRTPRPQSMLLPRLPSSPGTRYTSRPQSLVASPAESLSFFSSSNILAEDLEPADNEGLKLSEQISAEDLQSIDSGLGESCSTKSAAVQSSRRSTLASQRSMSPSSWGLPLPASPYRDDATVKAPGRRKPRRFMAGSTQLKPLLLPSLAGDMISSQTSSLVPAPLSPTRRYISDESLDPTISFLSHPHSSPTVSPAGTPSWMAEPPNVLDLGEATQMPPTEGQFLFQDHQVGCQDGPGDEVLSFVESTYASENASQSEKSSDEENELTAILDRPAVMDDPLTTIPMASVHSVVTYQPRLLDEKRLRGSDIVVLRSPVVSKGRELVLSKYMDCDRGSSVQISGVGHVNSSGNVRSGPLQEDGIQGSVFSLSPTPNPRKRRKSSWSSDASASSQASEATPLLGRKSLIPRSPALQNLTAEALLSSPDLESQSPQKHRPPGRCLSPLEFLRQTSGSKPIASVTIQTIYGTLSRYTTYIREIKRDPTALARRVIANAWHANWKILGRLSWWVLGLFIRPSPAPEERQAWDWDEYDAAGIADRIQQDEENDRLRPPRSSQISPERRVRFEENCEGYRTRGSKSPARPVLKGGKEGKSSWGKSLYLWGKFSVAILLAVGGAMVKGPAEMLKECDERERSTGTSKRTRRNEERARSAAQATHSTPEMFAIPEQSPLTRISFDFSMDFPTAGDDPGRCGGGSPGVNSNARQRGLNSPRSRLARPRSSGVRWVSRAWKGSKINLASSPTRSRDEPSGFSSFGMNRARTPRAGRDHFPLCEDLDAGNTLDPGGHEHVDLVAHADRVDEGVHLPYDPTSPPLPSDWGEGPSPSALYPTYTNGEGGGASEEEVKAVQKSLRNLRLTEET